MIYHDAYDRLCRARICEIDGDVYIRVRDAREALRIGSNVRITVREDEKRMVREPDGMYMNKRVMYMRLDALPREAAMNARCPTADVRRFVREHSGANESRAGP